MLTLHRRHEKKCEHANKGWNYTLCDCPVWCDGSLNGRRYVRSLHTRQWERALTRIAALSRGADIGIEPQAGRTVAQAVEAFIESRSNLRPSSVRSYRGTLEPFALTLGARQVDRVMPPDIEGYLNARECKGKPLSPRTARKELWYIRTLFAWCIEQQWATENPARKIRTPKCDDFATLPFSEDEVMKLLLACDQMRGMWAEDTPLVRQRARALVLTLLYSGLRVGDVAQLKRGALESDGHLVLRIMKTGVRLKVLLHPEAVKALRGLPGNVTYFFWSGRGSAEDCAKSLWKTVHRVGKLAGIHAHPHRFRDTFAVELLTKGADIRTVQKLMGHESVRTTEKHYAHFVAAHQALLDSAVSKLDFGKPARPVLMSQHKRRLRNG